MMSGGREAGQADVAPRTSGASLFSEKIPQARQLYDVVRRQNRADEIRLRRGVNFIQVTLRFRLQHEFLDAFVKATVPATVW